MRTLLPPPAPALVLALALALAPGCGTRVEQGQVYEEDRPVARVEGNAVAQGLFKAYLRDNINLGDESRPAGEHRGPLDAPAQSGNALADEVQSRLLDRFLLEQALVQQARRAGIEAGEEELDRFAQAMGLGPLATLHEGATLTQREYLREYLEDCYLVKRFLQTKVLGGVAVGDEEVRAYYAQHASRFSRPDRVRLRQIRVDSLQEAVEALRQIGKDGEAFLRVAAALSEVEGEQGKDLGMWDTDHLPDAFAAALAPLKKGDVTGVVQDPEGGFSLFYLMDKIEGGTTPLEEVRETLRAQLGRDKKDRAAAEYLATIEKQARIELFKENLGFNYIERSSGASAASGAPSPQIGETPGEPLGLAPAATPAPNGGAS